MLTEVTFSQAASGALMSIQPALIRRILLAIEQPTATSSDPVIAPEPQLSLLGLVFAPIETANRDNRTAYLFACLATLSYLTMTHFDIVFGMMNQRFAARSVQSCYIVAAVAQKLAQGSCYDHRRDLPQGPRTD